MSGKDSAFFAPTKIFKHFLNILGRGGEGVRSLGRLRNLGNLGIAP
jgi:hypothetical protein